MRLSQQARRRRFSRRTRSAAPSFNLDLLESRRLMSGETVQTPIPPVLANTTTPTDNNITLNQYFNDATLPGTLATFNTSSGEIQVALTDAATPMTVANFLNYADSGAYNDSIFHRVANLENGQPTGPSNPASIIQGGGYNLGSGSLAHIPTNAPVNDEYTTELYGDVAGTLAMAKTSYADSATSEWYFNVTDNTSLDTPTTDPNGVTTSYTVFGTVLSGQDAINAIAALPAVDLNSTFSQLPVTGLTEAQIAAGDAVNGSNLVYTYDITTEPGTSYTVSSDNSALVAPQVSNGVLSFTYGAGLFGTANVTINASNLDGSSTSTVMSVTVPNPATPSAGPVTTTYAAPYSETGKGSTFSVLGGDTDSLAALNPASVTIVSGPADGTATVNSSDGYITYIPTAGYIGADTLTYTVTDEEGNTSAPGTVTLDAVPTPIQVTIGPLKTLVFTQPDGAIGRMSITNGQATVTFSSFQVTIVNQGNLVTASGLGTTITNVTIKDTTGLAGLTVTSASPITLGSVDDPADMQYIHAKTSTMSGDCNIQWIGTIDLAAMDEANVVIASSNRGQFTNLVIPTVTNTVFNASSSNLGLVQSRQWLNTDQGDYYIKSFFIHTLTVTGEFDEGLELISGGIALAHATVATPTAAWDINGSIYQATVGSPSSSWSIDEGGQLRDLLVTGNLSSSIEAGTIGSVTVDGATDSATFQTTERFFARFIQVGKITFKGTVASTVVFSNGSIGSISALSMTNSRIYAGVNITVAQNGDLAAGASDLTADAKIGAVVLNSKAATAFSNCLISADVIGTLRLGNIDTADTAATEGISGVHMSGIAGVLMPGGVLNANAADLKTAAALAAYETKEKLALGDFVINVI